MTQTDKIKLIDESKNYILKMCDAPLDKYSLFFTSGEIESNNIILCCAVNAYKKIRKIKPHVVVSTVEHNSVITYAKSLLDSGQIELSIIKPNSYGCILSDTVANALKDNTCFVSITYINRELGSVNNIEKITAILHEKKIPLHCDCTYLFGKHKLDLKKTNIDTATIAFDKINGPVGVGALIISNDLYNGYKLYEHSTTLKGNRTPNIPAIASAVEAFRISLINRKNKNKKLLKFRNEIINKLSEKCQTMTFANFMKSDAPPLEESKKSKNKLVILGPPTSNESYYTPSILSLVLISDKKKSGLDIKTDLEKKGIIIGVPDLDNNFMYKEIGMPEEALKHIIRISLSDDIKQNDVNKFVAAIKCVI
jgi:cysteine sulfinate desulfinase/cysteine desulfurase-like protein